MYIRIFSVFMSNPLFNIIRNGLFLITFLLAVSVQAQQRDRLGGA